MNPGFNPTRILKGISQKEKRIQHWYLSLRDFEVQNLHWNFE